MESPAVEVQPQTRPRSKSTFSFRSQNSDKSASSKPKIKMDLTETAEEKRKSRFSGKSKVNPNRALNEPQPVFEALERPTLPQLNSQQFRDSYGNLIFDPDRTNPTRHRLERPLDTIRAFEAAIDNGHKRRSQAVRAESAEAIPSFQSRRASTHYSSLNEIPHFAPKYSPASAYGSRHTSFRGNYDYTPHSQFPQRRSMPYRMTTSPMPIRASIDHSVYNSHVYHESHDTVNTAAESNGSQSTEPLGYSTDPSSENSSIDRVHAIKQMDSGDAYGGGQYGRGSPMHSPIQEEYWQDGRFQQQDAYEQPMPQQAPTRAPIPQQAQAAPRPPIPQQMQAPARLPATQTQATARPSALQQTQVSARSSVPQQGPVPARSSAPQQAQAPVRRAVPQQAQGPARQVMPQQPSARSPVGPPPPSSYHQISAQPQTTQPGGAAGQGNQAKSGYPGAAAAAAALAAAGAQQPAKDDGRKSWLKRRFSKNAH